MAECPAYIRVWPNDHENLDVHCRVPWEDHETTHVGTFAGPMPRVEVLLEPGLDREQFGAILVGQNGGAVIWRALTTEAVAAVMVLGAALELIRSACAP